MSMNKSVAKVKGKKEKVKMKIELFVLAFLLLTFALATACRYDMQDQPRYKAYKKSDFFADGRSSRELPDGTVPRGFLRADKALYTGKKEGPAVTANVPAPTIDASGATIVSSFPNDVEEFPVPVTKELIDRGQQRYNIFCAVCHGPTGSADGMIVRRGFPKPPTYHDDRLRNAPVGHFFDVISNGWGKMNGYASQVQVADRWAIIAYIRALQLSHNPNGMKPMPMAPKTMASPVPANPNSAGGIRN